MTAPLPDFSISGAARCVIAINENALMSRAFRKSGRWVSAKGCSNVDGGANATLWTRMSRPPQVLSTASKTRSRSASEVTSAGTTSGLLTVAARSRTPCSMRSPWKVKANSAPSRAKAWAMAQAIDRRLATPKTSARRPSRSGICPQGSRSQVPSVGRAYSARGRSEAEMEAQGLIKVAHKLGRHNSEAWADALDGDRTNLLRLCLGVAIEPGTAARQSHLEGVDAVDVRCHGYDGHHTPTEAHGRCVCSVVTDDHRRSPLVRLGATGRVEVNHADLAAQHYPLSPSPLVVSHASASPLEAHSRQASS